jgi:hypothetical protein
VVTKKQAERRQAYEANLPPEVVGATSRALPETHDGGEIPYGHTVNRQQRYIKTLSKETDEAFESFWS